MSDFPGAGAYKMGDGGVVAGGTVVSVCVGRGDVHVFPGCGAYREFVLWGFVNVGGIGTSRIVDVER